jgi:hypothetical protein
MDILDEGGKKANEIACRNLENIKKIIGLK